MRDCFDLLWPQKWPDQQNCTILWWDEDGLSNAALHFSLLIMVSKKRVGRELRVPPPPVPANVARTSVPAVLNYNIGKISWRNLASICGLKCHRRLQLGLLWLSMATPFFNQILSMRRSVFVRFSMWSTTVHEVAILNSLILTWRKCCAFYWD